MARAEPSIADLPEAWPPCRASRCGSRAARARSDGSLGPTVVECENGHFRAYRAADAPDDLARLAGSVRRRTEVLDDADRCALCGTPPVEHPLHPDDAVRADRDVWAWLQRWRPETSAACAEALRTATPRAGGWRLALPAAVRERLVDALRSSTLVTAQVVPAGVLATVANGMTKRELDVAAGWIFAACARCDETLRERANDGTVDEHAFARLYVDALYGGDEAQARGDASRWRTFEKIVRAASRALARPARIA